MQTAGILAFLREQEKMYAGMMHTVGRGEKLYVKGKLDATRYAIKHIEEQG